MKKSFKHFGVLGMKWGVRKTRETTGRRTGQKVSVSDKRARANSKPLTETKKMSTGRKFSIAFQLAYSAALIFNPLGTMKYTGLALAAPIVGAAHVVRAGVNTVRFSRAFVQAAKNARRVGQAARAAEYARRTSVRIIRPNQLRAPMRQLRAP
jgi:hypothetical protein